RRRHPGGAVQWRSLLIEHGSRGIDRAKGAKKLHVWFGMTYQQPAAFDEALVKMVEDALDDIQLEIDRDVAAQDQVEGKKVIQQRREGVGDQVVVLKGYAFFEFRLDPPRFAHGDKAG